MFTCPDCGKSFPSWDGLHTCEPKQVITSVPDFHECSGCGKNFPMNSVHTCPNLKALRSAMYGKEAPVDVDTANEMRVHALGQAVWLGTTHGAMNAGDIVAYADSFFKFLMGESQ